MATAAQKKGTSEIHVSPKSFALQRDRSLSASSVSLSPLFPPLQPLSLEKRELTVDARSLLGESKGLSLSDGLVSGSSGLHLVSERLGSELLLLGLVDELHEDSLVLEDVTLGLEVERVVQVLVDLARVSVLSEQSSEHSHSSHPLDLGRESRVGGTLPLSGSGVSSLSLGGEQVTRSGPRVDRGRLDNDVSILDELGNSLSRVGVRDLGSLLGVEPD